MTLSKIQEELGIAHYTLYKYANKLLNIENMGVGTFFALSDLVGEEPKELYQKIKEYLNN
jgi:hypothetical protein|nr:MAG TPA: Regulatory protein-modification, helix-turn-helix, transcriptional regulator, DNA [Caudoviricetes sp.]